jgi:hypothetical protein
MHQRRKQRAREISMPDSAAFAAMNLFLLFRRAADCLRSSPNVQLASIFSSLGAIDAKSEADSVRSAY